MMKFVYVVTSSERDFYLEQAILSMHSLQMHNPNAHIVLLTENDTIQSFKNGRERIYDYVTETIDVKVPDEMSPMQKSRFIKTSMRMLVNGDFLFIDTDTIITDTIEINRPDADVMAVIDKHLPISIHPARKQIRDLAYKIGWNIPENDIYFNSGVMYVKDSYLSKKIFLDWHKNWLNGVEKFGINLDQPMLALANAQNSYAIKELSGEYNCQIVENGLKFLSSSKIIHYFASGVDSSWVCPYIFRDKNIYQTVKYKGITPEIDNIIKNGRNSFISKVLIIGGDAADIYTTPLVSVARRISRKFPMINTVLFNVLKLFGKI